MKIVVISGNPDSQEQFLVPLLTKLHEDGQTVHIHNVLHNEMNLASRTVLTYNKSIETDSCRFHNEEAVYSLAEAYKVPVLGQSFGYSFAHQALLFRRECRPVLDSLVNLVHSNQKIDGTNLPGNNHYVKLICSVKDIKYIDTLIIYNVVSVFAIKEALARVIAAYSRDINTYWLHVPCTDSVVAKTYDYVTDTKDRFERVLREYIPNISMDLALDVSTGKHIPKIVEGAKLDSETKSEKKLDSEPSIYKTGTVPTELFEEFLDQMARPTDDQPDQPIEYRRYDAMPYSTLNTGNIQFSQTMGMLRTRGTATQHNTLGTL